MGMRSGFEAKVVTAFAAATLVVISLATVTWNVAEDTTRAARKLAETHELLHNLARTRGYTLQIELASQGFRLSGDPTFLAERDAAIAEREAALARIKQLTDADSEQRRRWADLRQVIDQRLAIARQVETLRKTQGQAAAEAYVATAPLRSTRALTYRLLGEMDADERHSLAAHEAAHAGAQKILVTGAVLLSVSLAGLLLGTYLLIQRQLRSTTQAQRALAESEENLSTTLHSIGEGVLCTDTRGRVTRMNAVAERLTGWSRAEAAGRPIRDVFRIIREQTAQPVAIPAAPALARGDATETASHTVLISRDGTRIPIDDSAAPIRDRQGRTQGMVLVFRDVTAVREAEWVQNERNVSLERSVLKRTAQLRESQAHLLSVTSAVPALIAYVGADQRYVYVNQQYRERFAPERADITGLTVREILGEARYAIAGPLIEKVLEGEPQGYDWQPFPGVWHAIRYLPRKTAEGEVTGYYVLGTDISERKQAEERIQALNVELERRVRELEHASRALRTLSAGNRTMLRAQAEQPLLESMCHAIVTIGGYGMAVVWYCGDGPGVRLEPMAEYGYPGGIAGLRELGLDLSDTPMGGGVTSSAIRSGEAQLVRNMRSDPGHAPWKNHPNAPASGLSCPLRVDGKVIGALTIYDAEADTFREDEIALLAESADDLAFGIGTLRARAEQRRVQAEIDHLAHHDALTGLPNALGFAEALTAAVEGDMPPGKTVAALQLNIERLGEINDVLGFAHGDQILRDFGARLRENLPQSAVVARLRGDEFAVLTPASDAADALALAARLECSLSRPFAVAGLELEVSAKTGIALYPEHGSTANELMRRMGKALYRARARGTSPCVFAPEQQQGQTERLTMVGELRKGIEGGQLSLYLQPKVEIASGRVCGAEALVRWRHPRRGLLAPGLFIGLAEQTGLIRPLTEWLIGATLDLLRDWQAQGCALPVAINLSARNFRDEQLFEKLTGWRAARGVASGLLEVEITESTVMENTQYALRMLHALREESVPLYLDDFGTGFSSLSYLQRLPLDHIKIDQSFVAAMTDDRDSAMIVRSTIDLIHDLGRKAVAEGVETAAHWDQLARLGCDVAQGYFISRPMPAEDFQAWVQAFRHPRQQTLSA